MTLHLTRDEADQLDADGRAVLIREGVAYMPAEMWGRPGPEQLPTRPPAEFVEAAKPCETCGGRGTLKRLSAYRSGTVTRLDSKTVNCHCLDGKRRIAAVVPCPNDYTLTGDCGDYGCTGLVTVATVVVEWGPLEVVEFSIDAGPDRPPHIFIAGRSIDRWDGQRWHYGIGTLPPDVDPATLVGQYALDIKMVTE